MSKNDNYFFKSSHNVPVRKTDVILYDVAAKMCQFGDLIKHYEVSLSQMLHDILGHDQIQ